MNTIRLVDRDYTIFREIGRWRVSLGEKILRLIEKACKIETKREKELLYPLIEEVYPEAKKRCPHLGYIDLCIIDKVTVQACAMGKHTIAITKGAIETFSGDELKSMIAHEICLIQCKRGTILVL